MFNNSLKKNIKNTIINSITKKCWRRILYKKMKYNLEY